MAIFLQISDLHIGHVDPQTNSPAPLDAVTKQRWRYGIFQGFLGHSQHGLEELQAVYTALDLEARGVGADLRVIVTGDLTACGHRDQYNLAVQYLTSQIGSGFHTLGLDLASSGRLVPPIPGNHDHWPGSNRIFGPNSIAAQFTGPWLGLPIPLRHGPILVIDGLNSDADVGPWSLQRLRAEGSFVKQSNALLSRRGRRPPNELRVLLCHHSPLFSKPHKRLGTVLHVDSKSKLALAGLLQNADYSVVLTGHAHDASVGFQTYGGVRWYEGRCGSTTQRDYFGDKLRDEQNHLLIHRLYYAGSQVWWATEEKQRKTVMGPLESHHRHPPVCVWP